MFEFRIKLNCLTNKIWKYYHSLRMAFLILKSHSFLPRKNLNVIYQFVVLPKIRNQSSFNLFEENKHQCLARAGTRAESTDITKSKILDFDSSPIIQYAVSNEIQFYRDSRNNFTEMSFSDTKEPYGPPLAIILPWKHFDKNLLKKLIEFYGEKGFDVLTVRLETEQLLYPCVAGNAMNVVSDLLEYLNDIHKHRPYVFHGFSIGVYIFGEIMAQFSDHYEIFRKITNNIKGCLWDSPVDVLEVKSKLGKFFYPKNWFRRLCCNRDVKNHFKKHHHDSVVYWLRSRDNFCNPIIKVPNVFFISYTDILSNPCSLQAVQKVLEYNGIPIFQKTWWDSGHGLHLQKYCYEYMYGMVLFFNLSNLFPDEYGKYKSSLANASLTNLRLRKATRDSFL